MLFPTVHFLLFFLVVHQVFWRLPSRYRKEWLLLASLFFYGYWSLPFLLHFVAMVLVSYLVVRLLKIKRNIWILWSGVGLNLLNLFFFKYTNSFLGYLAEFGGVREALVWREELGIILPLAISFYTFQIIAFLVDVWRGEIKEISLTRFAVFILFFPQLIAGPIMRHGDFLPQLDQAHLREQDTFQGIYLFILGVIKKMFIADPMALLIDPVWSNPGQYDALSLWVAIFGFTAQVYADFSGYTDMARGLARLLGYDIPENFYFPFLSTSFSQLWNRWHVTLSSWLRDYLYIPLGGNRVGIFRHYFNLMVVMSLGGLWHGNTYNYFIWGFSQGVLLSFERFLGMRSPARHWYTALPRNFLVMAGWLFGLIFFRSSGLQDAGRVLSGLWGFTEEAALRLKEWEQVLPLVAGVWGIQFLQKYQRNYLPFLDRHRRWIVPLAVLVLFYLLVRMEKRTEQFIYFQF